MLEERRNPLPRRWDRDVDVVIIGAGPAGMCAAIESTDAGANVLVLEKMRSWGGAAPMAGGGISGAGTKVQRESGVEDSPDLFYKDILEGGLHQNIEELARVVADMSGSTIDWLLDLGWRCGGLRKGSDHSIRRTHWCAGTHGVELTRALGEAVRRRNIPVLFETRATKLIVDPGTGRVVGVEAEGKEGRINIRAKTTVLVTGGFGGSAEMVDRFNPAWKGVLIGCYAGATGDGLLMAMKIGADVTHIPYMTLRECGIEVEGTRRGAVFSWVMSHYEKDGSIFVNKEGRRFVKEDVTPHSGLLKEEMFKQPDKSLTVIMDSISWKKTLDGVYSLGWTPSEAEKKGIVKNGASIMELAKMLGINPKKLEETVAKYNSYVEAGNDPDFGSKSLKRKIEMPPFYGFTIKCIVWATDCGLRIDKNARVLDAYLKPIPGLYAAGEVVGGIPGFNSLGGNHLTYALVFGRIAGKASVAK